MELKQEFIELEEVLIKAIKNSDVDHYNNCFMMS